jgi:hypothetical protein
MKKIVFTAVAVVSASVVVQASTGTPPTFPATPPNLYGDIDASQSTYTQTPVGGDALTLALDATPHFKAPLATTPPPVNLLSPGVYGVSTGLGGDGRSVWNYDFAATTSLNDLLDYVFTLTIKNEGNGLSTSFNPSVIGDNNGTAGSSFGNSESLDFTTTFPADLFFGSIGYNPNANDTYDFTLTAQPVTGGPAATDVIKVIAGTGAAVPDATSTMALMSFGLGGLGLMSRRFRK